MKKGNMKIEKMNLDRLKPLKVNVRHHSAQQIREMVRAVNDFGQTRPMVIDEDGNILVGNCLYEALKEMKRKDGDVFVVSGLSEKEKKKLILSDNKLYRLGMDNYDAINEFIKDIASDGDFSIPGFDEDIVKRLTQEIADDTDECVSSLQSDYNATAMGVPRGEVDFTDLGQIFDVDGDEDTQQHSDVKEDDFDEETETNEHGVKQGDIWQLGRHRLMCGDATREGDVLQLTNKEDIDMTFTDPPYGINVVSDEGHVGAKNVCEVGTYSKVINDDTTETAEKAYKILKDITPRQIIWGGNYFTDFLDHSDGWVVWDKRGDITSNNFADGEMAWCSFHTPLRIVKQIWMGMVKEGEHDKRVHPTQKPVRMLSDILQMFTDDDNKIIDVFGGSGSTLIACEQTNRQCYMMELDPHYCDVIISRWEKLTGQKALKLDV